MSLKAMVWALDTAHVDDPGQLLVLIALAERADDQGRNAWPGKAWLAERARCSTRTVQRHLQALRARALIEEGDQRLVDHIRPDRRPTVYDLVMTRGDNASPREDCGKPIHEGTPTSPRDTERGDIDDTNGETTVSPKPSLLPTEETATATRAAVHSPLAAARPAEQQRQQPLASITEPDLLELQAALDAAGFEAVRWSGLRYTERIEISDLLAEHGVHRLIRTALDARRAHASPPGHARAWLTLWRDLRPEAPASVARCQTHSERLPCRGCAADAKAAVT
jgi:hypothetical protein